jgi:hypothetical protein
VRGEISFASLPVSAAKLRGCHGPTATKFAAGNGDDADIKRPEASIVCKTTTEIKGVGFYNNKKLFHVFLCHGHSFGITF